jgi:uncharacterized protein YoxC
MDASDAWRIALAIFLILTGVGITYALVRLGGLFSTADTSLKQTMGEVVPMLGKASTTIDHVNDELEKVGHITDSAVDALDSSVRTINSVLGTPARAVSGVSAGISQAFQSLRGKRGQRGGVV